MAIPTPRSYTQILGDQVDTFLSRLGLPKLKKGSPVLSVLEAAAMSDFRGTEDVFNMLASAASTTATGVALDRQAADEDLIRLSEIAASGVVTISDSNFDKISSKIYSGAPAPIVGSSSIKVADASDFTASGNLYIGRGTSNVEGPLAYTSRTNSGGYWTIALTSPTQKFHRHGEVVTLAQGGNRVVGAGTVVQTVQGGSDDPIQFTTLFPVTIPDGEKTIEGVAVAAKLAGISGNVPSGAIVSFASPPFSGATVTNPQPLTNGQDSETDADLRERIKATRRSRSKGTSIAMKTAVLGVTSPDENKRIISSSFVRRPSLPSLLVVDDGTGYEETGEGVGYESLTDTAVGGEEIFSLTHGPVQLASVETIQAAPFAAVGASKLAVRVGGIAFEHVFSVSDFVSLSNATAYEVVASVNADSNLGFSARTSNNGQNVTIFAREPGNDDIEVIEPVDGDNANDWLQLPTGRHDTLRLYRDDHLLVKDGQLAQIRSVPFGSWGTLTTGDDQTLTVSVDGTTAVEYTFNNQVFVDAGTGYSTVGNNSLAAWVTAINSLIPGLTATSDNGAILLTSNLGRQNRARLQITAGTLTPDIFAVSDEQGRNADYTLDRFRAEIQLVTALSEGQKLAAGSLSTRGFFESLDIDPVTLSGVGTLYMALDGDAEIISTGISPTQSFTVTTNGSGAWGTRYRLTTTGSPFAQVTIGDWLVIWDTDSNWTNYVGVWRIVDSTSTQIEIEGPTGLATPTSPFPDVGIAVVRYPGQLQVVTIPAGANYTADTFVDEINEDIVGATAEVYRTDRLRLRTNTLGLDGDVAVVAADENGLRTQLSPDDAVASESSHVGGVESAGSETGTPTFQLLKLASGQTQTASIVKISTQPISPDLMLVGAKNVPETGTPATEDRFGNNRHLHTAITSVANGSPSTVTLRKTAPRTWMPLDRLHLASPYAIGPEDELAVVVDNDTDTKRFVPTLWRALRPQSGVYGQTNAYKDIGDGTASPTYLAAAFDTDFDFNDFAIFMRARVKSHSATAAKSILWRYKRFGLEGENAFLSYTYPTEPDQSVAVLTNILSTSDPGLTSLHVRLPSGTEKIVSTIRNSTSIGYGFKDPGSGLPGMTLCLGFPIASATRAALGPTVTLTLTLPSGIYAITNHGLVAGNKIYVKGDANFPSGVKTLSATTTTTVSYVEAGAFVTTPNIGTVSFDVTGESTFDGATPGPVVVGDLVRIDNVLGSNAQPFRNQTVKITHLGSQYLQGYTERDLAADGATSDQLLRWQQLSDSSKINFFPLSTSNTSQDIADAVNDLDDLCPVSATVLGDGTGTISESTVDEEDDFDAGYQLVDGINWVKVTTNPPDNTTDYELEFKAAVDGGLTSTSDWANEEVRIAPITNKNLSDWFNSPGVSGLFNVAEVARSDRGRRIQIATSTLGSSGSVQIQGGSGNSVTASIVGTPLIEDDYLVSTVRASDIVGLRGGHWVALDNTNKMTKSGIITSSTALTSITSNVFDLTTAVATFRGTVTATDAQVEQQGRFVAIVFTDGSTMPGGTEEGDWVKVEGSGISEFNRGYFRIVRSTSSGFWIENPAAVVESLVDCTVRVISGDSLIPGDTLTINSDVWGAANRKTFTVSALDFSNNTKFTVTGGATNSGAVSALGDEAENFAVAEGVVSRTIKRVLAIAPNQDDATFLDVKFDSSQQGSFVSEAAGTAMSSLDKLAFDTDVHQGLDGYRQITGLIGEATRVVYGDESDSVTYPGVISEGSQVDLSGPLVKRISLSLSIRAISGYAKADIAAQVQSAAAAVINRAGVGQSVAISDIVAAITEIAGVLAVAILSPTYAVGSDLIEVQPHEKALVLSVDEDIAVNFTDE